MSFDISVRSGAGHPSNSERAIESMLIQLLARVVCVEKFPSSQLSVSVGIEVDDGVALSASINAVMCALIDLGIPLKTIALAASVATRNGELYPCQGSFASSFEGTLTQVLCLSTNKVLSTYLTGNIDASEFRNASSFCSAAVRKLDIPSIRKTIG